MPGGSQIDGAGSRYADDSATFTYRFVLPADAATGRINLEIDNQYLVHVSSDNQNWTEVLRETRDIRNGSNRVQWFIGINSYLQTSKTVYLRVGDSQPANGWGGAVSRVAVEYTRAGEQAARTSHQYDARGNLTRTTVDNTGGSPASLVTAISRDPRGLATQVTDPAGATTRLAYDSAGNGVTATGQARTIWRDGLRTDGFEPVTTVGRNTFGEATHERDAHSATMLTRYDAMGRPTSITAPPYTPPGGTTLTPVTTNTYNVDGQPATVTDPLGRVTTTAYDKYGRTVSRTLPDPDGSGPLVAPQWRYAYDRVGELLETTDPTGARNLATYNDLGHQITQSQTERVGTETFYFTSTLGRDDAGRLTTLTGPRDHTTTFQNNAAGQTVRVTDPVGRVAETRYDAVGRVTAEILAGARATSYRYDPAGRTIVESDHTVAGGVLSAPLRTRQTSYDGLGRPLTVTSPEGRLTQYAYDTGGNLASVTQRTNPADPATAITVALGYDGEGRRTRAVDGNGNATDYLFNDWDLPTAAVEPATPGHPAAADRTWTTVYDAAGQAVRDLLPGGVSRTRTFDGLGQITAETGAGTSSTTVGRGMVYDTAGRLARVSSPAGDYTYAWNDRGLLTRSTGPAGTSTFDYDAEGNLTSRKDPSGTGSFSYDNAGRIQTATDALSPRVATFSYTPTGEIAGISYGTDKPSRTSPATSAAAGRSPVLVADSGGRLRQGMRDWHRRHLVVSVLSA